ncbi:MAG: ABC1 kinase family protein [Chloroflexota bacterium]
MSPKTAKMGGGTVGVAFFGAEHTSRYSHAARYQQIARTLARHGFGYLVTQLGLGRHIPFYRSAFDADKGKAGPEHLRLALQELGATFIKLGQLLSTRGDLLPPEYVDELSKLQDALPPLPVEIIAEVITVELGSPPETLFRSFDPEPVAAASTSQVHAAVLPTGEEVAVKVQRPGVARLFNVDLAIIKDLAGVAAHRTGLGKTYDLVGIADEMANTLRPGLNYRAEGRNAERFRSQFADDPAVYIPAVFWEYTSSRVLTLERLEGCKITDTRKLDEAGVDRHELALRSARVLLKMVFENGLFHADPHPGNFFVMDDGRLGLVDFGLVGYLGEATREELSRLFVAIVNKEPGRMVDSLVELGAMHSPRERPELVRDLERLLVEYYELPLGEIPVGQLLGDAMRVARRRGLALPTNLALLATVIAANEGMGRSLDPDFRLLEVAKPFARHLLTQVYSPWALAQRFGSGLVDAVDVAPQLPGRIQGVLRQIERGDVEVGLRTEQVDHLVHQISASANRLALSAIVAAFIVSIAILLSAYRPAGLTQLSGVLLIMGFVTASALGLWLFIGILRSG